MLFLNLLRRSCDFLLCNFLMWCITLIIEVGSLYAHFLESFFIFCHKWMSELIGLGIGLGFFETYGTN